jgi:hypothetical protein
MPPFETALRRCAPPQGEVFLVVLAPMTVVNRIAAQLM